MPDGSSYGVHRFYGFGSNEIGIDAAQIVSAAVLQYTRDMGVDSQIFVEMTKAGRDEIHILDQARMKSLNIVNNGVGPVQWTIEAAGGNGVYLRGHQDHVFGERKLIFACTGPGRLGVSAYFDPQGHQAQVTAMRAISLYIDNQQIFINPNAVLQTPKFVGNYWINIDVALTPQQILKIRSAKTVGITAQFTFDAPLMAGIASMDFTDGANKMPAILATCH